MRTYLRCELCSLISLLFKALKSDQLILFVAGNRGGSNVHMHLRKVYCSFENRIVVNCDGPRTYYQCWMRLVNLHDDVYASGVDQMKTVGKL